MPLALAFPVTAQAHCEVGERTFVSTITFDDPCGGNLMSSSQRVSRGFHRLGLFLAAITLVVGSIASLYIASDIASNAHAGTTNKRHSPALRKPSTKNSMQTYRGKHSSAEWQQSLRL